MPRSVLAALAIVALATGAHAQGIIGSSCVFNFTDRFTNLTWNYDLSSLKLPYGQDYRGFDDNVIYQYYWNVCGAVACTNNVAGVCQMRVVSGQYKPYHNLGFYDGSAEATWDVIDPRTPDQGVKLVLANGDACSGGSGRVSTINIDCMPGAPDPTTYNLTVNAVGCQYEFHVPSPAGCGSLAPAPSPPAPSSPGGSSGLSGGSIFLIIFFVFAFVYVAGGCIFRRLSYGVGGMEACPNHEFWSALPGYVSDGFAYMFNTITCRHTGGGASSTSNVQYDNVK